LSGPLKGLAGRLAETHPQASDPRLRGRTYSIPFDRVWSTAEALARRTPRWRLVSSDDQAGILVAEVQTLLSHRIGDARIEIGLDDNGQTRLDLRVVMRGTRRDLGGSKRIVGNFVKLLDAGLRVRPDQILDATRAPSWSS
jgi:hypothetical protein